MTRAANANWATGRRRERRMRALDVPTSAAHARCPYMVYLWIALGSALGGVARFGVSALVERHVGSAFPWSTLTVNVAGSLAIGFLAAWGDTGARGMLGSAARPFLLVGVLGGFTTFSTFSLQTFALLRAGETLRAGANAAGSVILCLVAVWLGFLLASLTGPKSV